MPHDTIQKYIDNWSEAPFDEDQVEYETFRMRVENLPNNIHSVMNHFHLEFREPGVNKESLLWRIDICIMMKN